MTSDILDRNRPELKLLSSVGRVIVWVGASATAIGVILASFGYLVESAYLARFGVRRGVIEFGQNEYIVTGGQFLIGIPGLIVTGAMQLVVRCWYLLPVIAAIYLLGRWRRLGPAFLWLAFAALHAVWLGVRLSALTCSADTETAGAQVAMLTFTTVVALAYAWLARWLSTGSPAGSPATPGSVNVASETPAANRHLLARAPYLVVLVMAVLMLPYVRGAYGQLRDDAVVQLDPGEAKLLCSLVDGTGTPEACRDEQWQLIAFGKDKVVLRNMRSREIYVAPSSVAQTFRIRGRLRSETCPERRAVP